MAARSNLALIPKAVRCAIYTRKSTDEGLNRDFNSLDAQRESAEAYILSQRQEGWTLVPNEYSDGGYPSIAPAYPPAQRTPDDFPFIRTSIGAFARDAAPVGNGWPKLTAGVVGPKPVA